MPKLCLAKTLVFTVNALLFTWLDKVELGVDSALAFHGKGAVVGAYMFAGAAMKFSTWSSHSLAQ